MKTTEAACLSEELCRLLREEGQIVSLGDYCIERVRGCLSMLTSRKYCVTLSYKMSACRSPCTV